MECFASRLEWENTTIQFKIEAETENFINFNTNTEFSFISSKRTGEFLLKGTFYPSVSAAASSVSRKIRNQTKVFKGYLSLLLLNQSDLFVNFDGYYNVIGTNLSHYLPLNFTTILSAEEINQSMITEP